MAKIFQYFPIEEIRSRLNLNQGVFRNLPSDLLALAFIPEYPPAGLVDNDFLNELQRRYGYRNYEIFEFFGDSVLDFIVVKMITEYPQITSSGFGSRIKSSIVNNKNLSCLLKEKSLCQYALAKPPANKPYKPCADIFEAIIGILYFWLDRQKINPIPVIEQWLNDTFDIKTQIGNEVMNRPQASCRLKRIRKEKEKRQIINVKNPEIIQTLQYWRNERQNFSPQWQKLRTDGWLVALDLMYKLNILPSNRILDIINLVRPNLNKIRNNLPNDSKEIEKIFTELLPGVDPELWESLPLNRQILINYLDWIDSGQQQVLVPVLNLLKHNQPNLNLPQEINNPLDIINYFLDNTDF